MKLEKIEKESTYHIYNRGINGTHIFSSDENKRYFLSLFQKHLGDKVTLYAYCLLENHYHFLLEVTDDEKRVTQSFSNFFNAYAKAFNKQEGRTGSLFEKHFKRKPVTDVTYLTHLLCYIHNNPIRNKEDETYCSYRYYLNASQPSEITIDKSLALQLFDSVENMRLVTDMFVDREEKEGLGVDLQGPLREDLAGHPDAPASPLREDLAGHLDALGFCISPISPEDAQALTALIVKNKPSWNRFFPQTVARNESLEKSIGFIDTFNQGAQPKVFLYTLKEAHTQQLIGLVYLKAIDWKTKKGELAYAIDSDFSGKGVVTAAVKDVMAFAFNKVGIARLEIFAHKSNVPSIRVAQKCGFQWEKTAKSLFAPPGELPLDMELYVLLKSPNRESGF